MKEQAVLLYLRSSPGRFQSHFQPLILQDEQIRPVGSNQIKKINVRIITASSVLLWKLVTEKKFREDLYYRLNIVSIESIPLRNRKADLLPLINNFIKKYEKEYGKSNITITPKAIAILTRHDWPGNVRELENIIQRLIVLCDNTIDVDLIPNQLKYKQPSESFHLKPLHEIEKAYILKVLSAVHNNKTKAAEILQIDRKTLRQKLL